MVKINSVLVSGIFCLFHVLFLNVLMGLGVSPEGKKGIMEFRIMTYATKQMLAWGIFGVV